MTTTEAINIARTDVSMYCQGRGWCVSYPYLGAWSISNEMSHAEARAMVRRKRIERALTLLGLDTDAVHRAVESGGGFEVAVRQAVTRVED